MLPWWPAGKQVGCRRPPHSSVSPHFLGAHVGTYFASNHRGFRASDRTAASIPIAKSSACLPQAERPGKLIAPIPATPQGPSARSRPRRRQTPCRCRWRASIDAVSPSLRRAAHCRGPRPARKGPEISDGLNVSWTARRDSRPAHLRFFPKEKKFVPKKMRCRSLRC
jgi:hypothetical protein